MNCDWAFPFWANHLLETPRLDFLCFCSTSLPLASIRRVWLTISRLYPLALYKLAVNIISAASFFFWKILRKFFRKVENRTQGCWVRSGNATSVLCCFQVDFKSKGYLRYAELLRPVRLVSEGLPYWTRLGGGRTCLRHLNPLPRCWASSWASAAWRRSCAGPWRWPSSAGPCRQTGIARTCTSGTSACHRCRSGSCHLGLKLINHYVLHFYSHTKGSASIYDACTCRVWRESPLSGIEELHK